MYAFDVEPPQKRHVEERNELEELARLFLKLGTVAFGGPAAHIAMMRGEVVERRRWMGEQEFLDLVGATNLIPGPNSTELAIHIGRMRAGWRGLIVAGACFILPAMFIVLALAALYVRYGQTPQAESLLYGITPVIVAIVAHALWGFLHTAIKGWTLGVLGAAALGLYLLTPVGEIPLLLGGALIALGAARSRGSNRTLSFLPLGFLQAAVLGLSAAAPAGIFLTFLKIGSVLFGSGYVLLAFLRSDFVGTGLLTDQQLLDAVAIGQFTPGPVFTTATFIGYLLAGVPGAVAATLGIFLPAFIFVAITGPIIPRLRRSPITASLLDGVNVVSLALMAAVTLQLGRAGIMDPFTAAIALISLVLLFRAKISSAWLVVAGGVLGLIAHALSG